MGKGLHHHHNPGEAEIQEYQNSAALIQVADHICNLITCGFGSKNDVSELEPVPGWELIRASSADLADLEFEVFFKKSSTSRLQISYNCPAMSLQV